MEDFCFEVNLRWLESVVSWKMHNQVEDSSLVWRLIWSHDGGLPMV